MAAKTERNEIQTPWLSIDQARAYIRPKRGRRFIRAEVKAGRLRGELVGGRRELFFRREWLDEWIESHVRVS
jgi:hypothetical protein